MVQEMFIGGFQLFQQDVGECLQAVEKILFLEVQFFFCIRQNVTPSE